jgi:hypothetical protein
MDPPRESGLLTPAKRRKKAGAGEQQKVDWRVTASQNLTKTSNASVSSGNGNHIYRHQQPNFFENQCVQREKNISDDTSARGAFVDFLQDLLRKKIVGAQVCIIIIIHLYCSYY